MSLKQMQSYVFTTKYARWNADLQRRETYEEAVERVCAMHAKKYEGCGVDAELAYARAAMLDRLVLGSQRALQFAGTPILIKHARIYNCTVSYCDRPRFFSEALWLLLCGAGVGFSVQHHHIARLPDLCLAADGTKAVYVVPDTIEGWADALGVMLASYGIASPEFQDWVGKKVTFDFSQIRPKGAPLSSSSGRAPGPEPLKRSLERIEALLERCVQAGQTRLRTIDCYDILMHASDAVLAGGVRRSASICIFSADDQLMAKAKTGNWFQTEPQRGRSNNSALVLRHATTRDDFHGLIQNVKQFGEPGFVWADSTEILYNPCVEIGLYPQDEEGRSGWAFCNLCEINMKACRDEATFERACRAAAILGSMQAGYTTFPYLGEVTERIVRREALLGCSMTGMMDNPRIAFDQTIQRRMARLILDVNAEIALKLGTNPAARATCVKPAGTTSSILGTASGIHPHHAKRYFRRIQANRMEDTFRYFELHNPRAVEKSVWSPNDDAVITFCVEVPKEAHTLNDLSAVELLKHVKLTQENWVAAGTRPERCAQPWLRHNVSNTITVRDHEWEDVEAFIYDNRDAFAGVSLLPMGGDLDYTQAPFCAVLTHEEIAREYGVGSIMASGLIVDGVRAFDGDLWAACNCALGYSSLDAMPAEKPVEPPEGATEEYAKFQALQALLERHDWVRRAKQFAARYFAGDMRRMTHCLKSVHNTKLWEDLQREYTSVDWTLLRETEDNTKPIDNLACGGGACEVR